MTLSSFAGAMADKARSSIAGVKPRGATPLFGVHVTSRRRLNTIPFDDRDMLKALSSICYLMMIGGIVALFFTHSLFSLSPLVIGPQAAAVLLMVWARLTFGRRSFHFTANPTEGELVTVGPYRYIRHPIYSAVCLFTLAGVAAHVSWSAAALFGLVSGGALIRMRCEEILLAARYPQYADYAAKTWRMIPYVY